jgi:flotillin
MTVISTDGAGSLAKTVASNVAQGLQLGTDLTGIDLAALLARLGGAAADGDAPRTPKQVAPVKAEALPAIDSKNGKTSK